LGSVAERARVSLAEMAAAAGISKTAMFQIVANNVWPVTTPEQQIKTGVEALLRERKASDADIEQVWWAHRSRQRGVAQVTDGYGRERVRVPQDPKNVRGRDEQRAAGSTGNLTQPIHERATDMLLAKQSLSYEASKAFTLFSNPFDGEVTSQEELFQNGELRFVREAMWQAGKNGRFVAVIGESGAGKTTLLGDLEDRIARDHAPVVIIRPSVLAMTESETSGRLLKASDIINAIILTIDAHASLPQTHEARTRKMLRMVEESAKVGNSHLLVIEEAHALPVNTAKALKRLHESCRIGRKPALGILLLGQPELRSKLSERRADMREVVQRCEVVELPPLDADLRGYLNHRAKAAGRELAELIDDAGIEEMRLRLTVQSHDRRAAPISLLYPLAINNLMTAALNVAASLGAPIVNRDVVRAI
jgi:type II secretory pathway predicted ATPase ExeA